MTNEIETKHLQVSDLPVRCVRKYVLSGDSSGDTDKAGGRGWPVRALGRGGRSMYVLAVSMPF